MIYENPIVQEEAIFNNKYNNPVYIVLMHTGTLLANTIKKITKDDLTHACIAFSSKLDPLYSFGFKGKGESGVGFSISDPKDDFFTTHKTRYHVYVMYVSDAGLNAMKNRLAYFDANKYNLKYDFKGLFNVWFGMDCEDHEKWFCTRFVMDLISRVSDLPKVASLWKASEIATLDNISLVNRGFNFYNYDKKITDKHCAEIKNGKYDPSKVVFEGISGKTLNDLGSKQEVSLSQYTKVKLTDALIHVYSKQISSLNDVKINNDTKGFIWLEDNKPVGILNVEEKDDGSRLINKFEVFGSYRGLGLSKQMLKVGYRELKFTDTSVPSDNKVAFDIFKSFGFKVNKRTDSMIHMSIERNMDDDDIDEATLMESKLIISTKTINEITKTAIKIVSEFSKDDDIQEQVDKYIDGLYYKTKPTMKCMVEKDKTELRLIIWDESKEIREALLPVTKSIAKELQNRLSHMKEKIIKRIHTGNGDEGIIHVPFRNNILLIEDGDMVGAIEPDSLSSEPVDSKYLSTAKAVQSKLSQLQKQFRMNFCDITDVDEDFGFATYTIRSDKDQHDLMNYVNQMNRMIRTTDEYEGSVCMSRSFNQGASGTLYIVKPTPPELTTEADFYKNPAMAAQKKMSRKKNMKTSTGDYIDDMNSKKLTIKEPPKITPKK